EIDGVSVLFIDWLLISSPGGPTVQMRDRPDGLLKLTRQNCDLLTKRHIHNSDTSRPSVKEIR
ncbi:unnamed protein product, partial [Allacma fusca]